MSKLYKLRPSETLSIKSTLGRKEDLLIRGNGSFVRVPVEFVSLDHGKTKGVVTFWKTHHYYTALGFCLSRYSNSTWSCSNDPLGNMAALAQHTNDKGYHCQRYSQRTFFERFLRALYYQPDTKEERWTTWEYQYLKSLFSYFKGHPLNLNSWSKPTGPNHSTNREVRNKKSSIRETKGLSATEQRQA